MLKNFDELQKLGKDNMADLHVRLFGVRTMTVAICLSVAAMPDFRRLPTMDS